MRKRHLLVSLTILAAAACDDAPPKPDPTPPASNVPATSGSADKGATAKLDAVPRLDFNRLAADLDLPIFWVKDENNNGAIDPGEVGALWGVSDKPFAVMENGRFAKSFMDAYRAIAKAHKEGLPARPDLSDKEKARRAAVVAELEQGRPSVLKTDLKNATADEKRFVTHILKAGEIIERLYSRQLGVLGQDKAIAADDTASRMMFYRNHGPYCLKQKTEKDPNCSALADKPAKISGLYPASIQKDKFCEALEARKDAKDLLSPFTAVVEDGKDLKAVPFSEQYKDDMELVSKELKDAAEAVTNPAEAALKAYLVADAQAFLDNKWEAADEAWSKMSSDNSKWYLRVAPDETYGDVCSQKAGFQVSFAKINLDSVSWRKMLEPLKNDMEEALAKLAGDPYKARKVTFHLPDFIDIIANAGDARAPTGATAGESLPNWGPVANESRGRTVVMTNIGTDADGMAVLKTRLESLYCKATFDGVSYDPSVPTMSTVLHEAAHNLGPAHEYKAKGKKDTELFGGALSATLEELKAQTSALYFADWLVDKGVVGKEQAAKAHVREVAWAFSQMSEGMYDSDNKPKPYAQLAAIQVGSLLKGGALEWKAAEAAPNGKDKGCFEIHPEKFAPVIVELEKTVLGIKARGDKDAANKLKEEHVDKHDDYEKLRATIAERWTRQAAPSFVYVIEM